MLADLLTRLSQLPQWVSDEICPARVGHAHDYLRTTVVKPDGSFFVVLRCSECQHVTEGWELKARNN